MVATKSQNVFCIITLIMKLNLQNELVIGTSRLRVLKKKPIPISIWSKMKTKHSI